MLDDDKAEYQNLGDATCLPLHPQNAKIKLLVWTFALSAGLLLAWYVSFIVSIVLIFWLEPTLMKWVATRAATQGYRIEI